MRQSARSKATFVIENPSASVPPGTRRRNRELSSSISPTLVPPPLSCSIQVTHLAARRLVCGSGHVAILCSIAANCRPSCDHISEEQAYPSANIVAWAANEQKAPSGCDTPTRCIRWPNLPSFSHAATTRNARVARKVEYRISAIPSIGGTDR